MILVGRYRSPFTRRVAVSMKTLGFRYELRPRTAWQHFDEVRAHNPIGRVPILILNDGETIFDSTAILDYLDSAVGPEKGLMPPPGPERRRAQQAVALALGVIDKVRDLVYETILRPQALRHPPWIERWSKQVQSGIAALEIRIAESWLVGEHFTQADVTTGVMYDFARLYCPALLPRGHYPRLDTMADRYGRIPAFGETRPEPE